MTTNEEQKARMRAYYAKNKHKWKQYTASQRRKPEYKEKQKEYSRQHYLANREKKAAQVKQYRERRKEWWAEYAAQYFQKNKKDINKRRRRRYHDIERPKQLEAKSNSEYVTVREAVEMLGAKLRTFREWVYAGRIAATKTPGGRYLLQREDVLFIQENIKHIPPHIKQTLGLKEGQ